MLKKYQTLQKHLGQILLLSFVLFALSSLIIACSQQRSVEIESKVDGQTPLPIISRTGISITQNTRMTPELESTIHLITTPQPVFTPLPTFTATIAQPSLSPTPSFIATTLPPTLLSLLPSTSCPILTDGFVSSRFDGAILLNTGRLFDGWWIDIESNGIKAISTDHLTPQQIYEPAKYISLSPDGSILATFKSAPEGNGFVLVLYSFITGQSSETTIPTTISEPIKGYDPFWLTDGRIAYITRLERTLGVGEKWDVIFIDPTTRNINHSIIELHLPDYEFSEVEQGSSSGFIAIDPTFEQVLYTAGNGRNHSIRLFDLTTNEVLWQEQSIYLENTFPKWSQDGQRVLFATTIVREDIPPETGPNGDWYIPYTWTKLISLNRNGQLEELPMQPFLGLLDYSTNNLSYSPSGRYIFYNFYNYDSSNIHAYIVDTVTGASGEICDPQSSWFASWPNNLPGSEVEIHWLPNDFLVYRTLINRNGQWFHSLRVLNIPNWTSQVIFESEPGQGIQVFGWAQLELFTP